MGEWTLLGSNIYFAGDGAYILYLAAQLFTNIYVDSVIRLIDNFDQWLIVKLSRSNQENKIIADRQPKKRIIVSKILCHIISLKVHWARILLNNLTDISVKLMRRTKHLAFVKIYSCSIRSWHEKKYHLLYYSHE